MKTNQKFYNALMVVVIVLGMGAFSCTKPTSEELCPTCHRPINLQDQIQNNNGTNGAVSHDPNIDGKMASNPGVTSRTLAEFLNAQGSAVSAGAVAGEYAAWRSPSDNSEALFASIDYAGVASRWIKQHHGPELGTSIEGKVTETSVAGVTTVKVMLQAYNALTYVGKWNAPFTIDNLPLIMGSRPAELVPNPYYRSKAPIPVLGMCSMEIIFTNSSAGAPLPDVVDAFFRGNASHGQSLVSISIQLNASGAIHNYVINSPTASDTHSPGAEAKNMLANKYASINVSKPGDYASELIKNTLGTESFSIRNFSPVSVSDKPANPID